MKQPIRFQGLSLNRDEHATQNGELALCANAEINGGSMRPSVISGENIANGAQLEVNIGGGTYRIIKLLFVHKNSSYTHYIGVANIGVNLDSPIYRLYYAEENTSTTPHSWTTASLISPTFSAEGIIQIEAIGNTFVITKSDGLHYFLFKTKNGTPNYYYLGQRPPVPQLQFSLELDTDDDKNTDDHFVECSGSFLSNRGQNRWKVVKEYRETVTEQVMARINHRIDEINEAGCFYAPFLIRYCYRLYGDDSMAWHSSPVLLYPLLIHPVTTIFNNPSGAISSLEYYIFMQRAFLKWRCNNGSEMAGLDDWSDIVKSVDFFITPQFSRIDTDGLIKETDHIDTYYDNEGFLNGMYRKNTGTTIRNTYAPQLDENDPIDFSNNPQTFLLPEVDEEAYFSRIRQAAEFFRLASVEAKSDNFTTPEDNPFKLLEFEPGVLKNITTQQQMEDDYHSHYNLTPESGKNMYFYNSRLHLYDVNEHIRLAQPFSLLFPYFSGEQQLVTYCTVLDARVVYDVDGNKRVIQMPQEDSQNRQKIPLRSITHDNVLPQGAYVFIPDKRAASIQLQIQMSSSTSYREILLYESLLLEGALAFHENIWTTITSLDAVNAAAIPQPNKIYQSEVNNPYFFPLSGRRTVGVGKILGLATVTAALSPGQYGYHDLIALCSDGIWTLTVTREGTYSEVHTLSRDVCSNPASVCMLDQSVLFATKRELARITESAVNSCSDMLNGPLPSASLLPGLAAAFATGGAFANATIETLLNCTQHPLDFFQNGSLLYDYASERVIVLPASPSSESSFVAYVLSLRDMTWSTMLMPPILQALNSYPYPYIQGNSGNVVCLSKPYDNGKLPITTETATPALIITRTLTFTTTMQVMRGFEHIHDLTTPPTLFVYGSNDNISWRRIGYTSRSLKACYLPSYTCRFFRVALFLNMRNAERYSSLILDIVEKYSKL